MPNKIISHQLRPSSRRTLTTQVYEELQNAIGSGALRPGQKLVIDAIAQQMNVSITPVREALMRLQREGLVTEIAYSGMHVSQVSPEELRELFAIRGVLEGYAVSLALPRLDQATWAQIESELAILKQATSDGDLLKFREHNLLFHNLILGRAPGPALQEMIQQLTRNTERFRRLGGLVLDQAYLEHAQREHYRLVDLLRSGLAAEAEALTRSHAQTIVEHLIRCLEATP